MSGHNYATDEPLVIAQTAIRSSSEAVDGSTCVVSMVWEAGTVHELWVTSRFRMPSGRIYKVIELRWMEYGNGYIAHIQGAKS